MDAIELFNKRYERRMGLNDKFDRMNKQFDSYDMIEFAESYASQQMPKGEHDIREYYKDLESTFMPSEEGVFHIIRDGNNTDVYYNGRLMQSDTKYGKPLTMDQCNELTKIKDNYLKSLQQENQTED